MDIKLYRTPPIKFSEQIIFQNDTKLANDIQILRAGSFVHNGAEVLVTVGNLETMVKNFDEKVRGVDLMLDYKHDSDGEAAAWFTSVYLSEDKKELWATVDWTPDGETCVMKKKYRYISADFHFNYKDNESLAEFGPTLFGAALTNRPVIKRMTPTILSETNKTKDQNMDLAEEIKKLKEQLAEKDAMIAKMKKSEEGKDLKLAENAEAFKLAEEKEQEEKERIEQETKVSAKKAEFDTKLSEGLVCEAQRESFMGDNMEDFIKNQASVNLSEKGNAGEKKEEKKETSKSESPAYDEIIELAEKDESDIAFSTKIVNVLKENTELSERYKKETEAQA